jgi:hypothetical protein
MLSNRLIIFVKRSLALKGPFRHGLCFNDQRKTKTGSLTRTS